MNQKEKINLAAKELISCFEKQGIDSTKAISNMVVDKSNGSIFTSKEGYHVLFEEKESFDKSLSTFVTYFRDNKPIIEISVNQELDFLHFTFICDTDIEGYQVQAVNEQANLKVIFKNIKGCTFENVIKELEFLSKI